MTFDTSLIIDIRVLPGGQSVTVRSSARHAVLPYMPSGADQAAVAVRPMTFILEVPGSNTILSS